MRGEYPADFLDWEVAEIEKFRDTHPGLYEWRKTAHLLPFLAWRPRGTIEQLEAARAACHRKAS